jgi:hypothetical protein
VIKTLQYSIKKRNINLFDTLFFVMLTANFLFEYSFISQFAMATFVVFIALKCLMHGKMKTNYYFFFCFYLFSILIAKKGLRNGERKIARKYSFVALKHKKSFKVSMLIIASFFPYETLLLIRKYFPIKY